MFRHLIKLIWNKKKQNILLISEMFISFLVLFAVFTLVVYFCTNYRKPMGFDSDNVWVVSYKTPEQISNAGSEASFFETVRKTIMAMPQVKGVSFTSDNYPLSHVTRGLSDVELYDADDNFKDVLNIRVQAGRWFNKEDALARNIPIIITASLKERQFGEGEAIGKLMDLGDMHDRRVIGIVEDIKQKGDYTKPGAAAFSGVDTASFHRLENFLVRVAPGTGAAFESELYKVIAGLMKNGNTEIQHLAARRADWNQFAMVLMIVLLIVATFLISNVALGLFGVLWYNISKRKEEIGLRRAVGATGRSISAQLVTESLLLASLSIIIGLFLAIQFPLLNVFDLPAGVYITAIFLSALFIYLLVLICSFYPGRQAAAIYPAIALHED